MTKDDLPACVDRRQVLLTAAGATTLLLIPPVLGTCAQAAAAQQLGRNQSFDQGWRFYRGEGQGFEAAELDDSAWRAVDVPHDWSVEDLPPAPADTQAHRIGPFDRSAVGGTATGFSAGGEGWYRKHFQLRLPDKGRAEILFEGIYMDSDVWLNGHHLGTHAYGYTPVAYDLTPFLESSGNNVLVVRVRNLGKNSRWYSGSGIYRHVWLDTLPEQTRIARWGVGIVTRRIVGSRADIEINTRLEDAAEGLTLVSRVKDERGSVVREARTPAAAAEVQQAMTIASARLWSPDEPSLYTLETELRRDREVLDRQSHSFGIRVVAFDADRGMTINAVPTKLRGGCIHHDNGLLGAAAFDEAEDRKVRLLKARGFNAVRPSHNPFSAAFLHACDRHGVLVLAETFDAWRQPKLPQDYAVYFNDHWRADLASLVLSARNHPSIVLWSIGNEIPGRSTLEGVETQWHLVNEVHRLDPTRAVTAAIHAFAGRLVTPSERTARQGFGGVPDTTSAVFLDVVGYNYKLADYEADHEKFPKRIFVGTESFPKDVAAIWELTDRTPWLIGDFVWTAMDYLGEAGIGGSVVLPEAAADNPLLASFGAWPWVNAFCGDIDLIGNQKAPSLARDVVWGVSPLEIAVRRPVPQGKVEVVRTWGWHDELASWTWPESEGKSLSVSVHTSADRVELRLNGRVVGAKPVTAADLKRVEFAVPYEPGVLEALAFRGNTQIARKQLATVGKAASIRLRPERASGTAGRANISYVAVEILDAAGQRVPEARHRIELVVSGPAQLVAFGSANPLAVGSFQSSTAQTWNGRALAILRGTERTGHVTIEARADDLRSGHLEFAFA
jgi:beta-galactosidase